MNVYNISSVQNFTTSDLTILPSQKFFPATSMQLGKLWTESAKSVADWTEMFQDSVMVHFYSAQTQGWLVQRNPHHEAYAALGPLFCPTAYWSTADF